MKSDNLKKVILNFLLVVVVFFTLYPLVIMLLDSFKLGTELSYNSWGFPQHPTFDSFVRLFTFNSGIIVRTYSNAIFVSVSHTFLTILISALAAYTFSKYKFKGRDLIFLILISTMMVPGELSIPPLYLLFSKIKWLNTYWIQIVPGIANVFCMFMLKQYIDGLPFSLVESARMDGAGHLRVFASIILPLASPAVGAMTILTFLGKWNDYLWPRIMLTKPKIMPIMVVLPILNDPHNPWTVPWELILAGCTVVTIPIIIVFIMFQDKFMSSVTIGAVKE